MSFCKYRQLKIPQLQGDLSYFNLEEGMSSKMNIHRQSYSFFFIFKMVIVLSPTSVVCASCLNASLRFNIFTTSCAIWGGCVGQVCCHLIFITIPLSALTSTPVSGSNRPCWLRAPSEGSKSPPSFSPPWTFSSGRQIKIARKSGRHTSSFISGSCTTTVS